jgi:hypothetical protein
MNPKEIARLITEDPDVINEDVSSLAREILQKLLMVERTRDKNDEGPWEIEPAGVPSTITTENAPELNFYINKLYIDVEVSYIDNEWSIDITLADPRHGHDTFIMVVERDALEAAVQTAEALITIAKKLVPWIRMMSSRLEGDKYAAEYDKYEAEDDEP